MLNPYAQASDALLPTQATPNHGGAARGTSAAHPPLYQRVRDNDSERMGGTQVHYNSFADFVTTFHEEANDPNVVGAADVLDVINPLQHLPVISQIYREVTGDTIKPGARIIGGAVFGGAAGLASSSVNAVVQEETGKDVAENLVSALSGEEPFKSRHADMTILAMHDDKTAASALQIKTDPEDDSSFSYTTATEARVPSEPQPPSRRASPQHAASAYQLVADAGSSGVAPSTTGSQRYERVVMSDPERMAGSFVRYS